MAVYCPLRTTRSFRSCTHQSFTWPFFSPLPTRFWIFRLICVFLAFFDGKNQTGIKEGNWVMDMADFTNTSWTYWAIEEIWPTGSVSTLLLLLSTPAKSKNVCLISCCLLSVAVLPEGFSAGRPLVAFATKIYLHFCRFCLCCFLFYDFLGLYWFYYCLGCSLSMGRITFISTLSSSYCRNTYGILIWLHDGYKAFDLCKATLEDDGRF